MKIISLSKLSQARDTIRNGGLVVFPSDTVYGLLVDATNEKAVEKLTAFKNRPAGKPISVFTSEKNIRNLVEMDKKQEKTLEALLPGQFTVILKSKHKVSKKLESEKGTLGIRIPDYKPINKLVEEIGRPITATSANVSGGFPHHSIESLLKQLPAKKRKLIDLIVDGGKLPRNKPSTIIDLTTPTIKILRQGDIKLSDSKNYISHSPEQTKRIAQSLLKRSLTQKPLIFILQGELGVGKTIFVKGIGEALGIKNIISPTFVIYYEYEIKKSKLIHVDLYNLEDAEEFKHLGLERYLQPGNIFCFEWGEKAEPLIDILRKKGKVIFVKMKYMDERARKLIISKLS
jgi:L-threonylcarbamoyladenylate synthase